MERVVFSRPSGQRGRHWIPQRLAQRLASAFLLALACAVASCAEGTRDPKPAREHVDASAPPQTGEDAGADGATLDAGESPVGDPCRMGEEMDCDCAGDGGADGTRTCRADEGSPLDGYFSACGGCVAPQEDAAVPMRCQDGDKNGSETDVDCGGSDCDRCEPDEQCVEGSDCIDGSECIDSRCSEPSTGDATFSNYDHAAYAYDRAVNFGCAGTTTFDSTGQGSFTTTTACSDTADEQPEVSCGVAQTPAGAPSVCILRASTFALGASHTLVLIGDKPVILAVDGDATIAGTIDASAYGATPGAGGNSTACQGGAGLPGQSDTDIDDGGGGGAGGAFAAAGGKGGDGDRNGPNDEGRGGAASTAAGDRSLVPLRGGCAGGDGGDGWNRGISGYGGAGGGAVQISARGQLSVSGTITAGGGGGSAGLDDEDGGGGGGSGGAILLEAGDGLTLTGSLRAHGGGGAGGSGTGGSDSGMSGGDGASGPTTGGAGGDAGNSSDGGSGGGGGSATDAAPTGSVGAAGNPGEDDGNSGGGGGGGGGSGGVIVVR